MIIFVHEYKMQGMLQGIAYNAVDVEQDTHLVPSLTPLLASNAANTTINTIDKPAVSHFLISHSSF